jgi:ABC-type phosphate/phosphonate transport system permease subunit
MNISNYSHSGSEMLEDNVQTFLHDQNRSFWYTMMKTIVMMEPGTLLPAIFLV